MNIEICKNCEKLKERNYSFVLFPGKYLGEKGVFVPCWVNEDTTFRDWLCKCKPVDMKNISFNEIEANEIEVHDDCPYKLDHQIYDWNVKK